MELAEWKLSPARHEEPGLGAQTWHWADVALSAAGIFSPRHLPSAQQLLIQQQGTLPAEVILLLFQFQMENGKEGAIQQIWEF